MKQVSLVHLLQCITACVAWTTQSMWPSGGGHGGQLPGGMPGGMAGIPAGMAAMAGGMPGGMPGGVNSQTAVNDFMQWAQSELFGPQQMQPGSQQQLLAQARMMAATTPAPMVTYDTAVQSPAAKPKPDPKPDVTKPVYTMEDFFKAMSAGVAAFAQGSSGAKGSTTTTTSTTPATTTSTTTQPTTTPKPRTQMTLAELLVTATLHSQKKKKQLQSNIANNQKKDTSTPPVKQEKRGCYYKSQWYKPNSEIERGQSQSWCYGTYCNDVSVVIHWDDHKCSVPQTTPPFMRKETTTVATTTEVSSDMLQMLAQLHPQSPLAQRQAVLQMFGHSQGAAGELFGPGSPGVPGLKPGTTEGPSLGCIHNGQYYAPGADIENHRDYGRCFGTYCNFNSKIVNWSDRCRATIAPFTAPPPSPPTQSMQSMQRQMQQLESLMKK